MADRSPNELDNHLAQHVRECPVSVEPQLSSRSRKSYLDEAGATIKSLGSQATYLVPLGVLGPFSQWLQFPEWMRDGTALEGSGPLPQSLSQRDDTIILANMLDRGHGPFLLERTLSSDRLITGPNVSLIVRNAPTVADALNNLAIALGATNPNIRATFQANGELAQFEVIGRVPPGRLLDFITAMRVILALRAVERILLRRADEARLQLALSRDFIGGHLPPELEGRAEFASSVNRLTFPADWMAHPNPDHDRVLWKIARQRVRAMERKATDRDFASHLRHRVSEILLSDHRVPRLKELSGELGMTDRTMGRKLSALGIRFQDIVDEERKSLINQHLADPSVSLAMIAMQSGFSSLSSFSRSFRTWFGTSPSNYRASDRDDKKHN